MTPPAPAPSPTAVVDYSRKWYVLAAIAMGIFLGTIDGSIVNVALPTLVDEFDTTFGVAQWVVLGYLLTQATLTLGIGRVGDIVGKKPIFTAGFVVFTAASMIAGLSPTIGFLIAARVIQAVGAAMIFALGFAIVTEAFPASERGRALGITGTMVSLGIMAGPILGGAIIEAANWRWIFFVNLPIGIIGTITAIRFIPNTKPLGGQRFDFLGAGAFFAALMSLLLALTWGQSIGFTDPFILGLFAVSAVSFAAFIAVERRIDQPMLDLSLFRSRDLSINLVTGFITFFAISGLLLLTPFYLTDVGGLSPREIGLVLAAIPITMGVVAPLSGALSDRIGSRPVTVSGLAIMLVGYVLGVFVLDIDTAVLGMLVIGSIVGTGMGVFQSPNNSAILGAVPSERLGVTSGMLTINRTTGMVMGIAVLGAVWAARTVAHAGGGTASDAAAPAQASGFVDTLVVMAVLLAAALVLGLWSWRSSDARSVSDDPAAAPRDGLL